METAATPPASVEQLKAELSDSERAAWLALNRGSAVLMQHLESHLTQRHGLRLDDYDVLMHLHMAGADGLRLGDLAERMTYSRPRLTHRLGRMIDAGLVERRSCDDDKRGGVATLTEQGAQVLQTAVRTKRDALRRYLFEPLDEQDLMALARIMTKVRARLGDDYSAPEETGQRPSP